METLANGNTVLVYEETTDHPDNDDDVVHIRFSNGGGANWTAEDTDLNGDPVAGFPNYPTGASPTDPYGPGDTYIFQAPNGDLWLHTWKTNYTDPGKDMLGTWHVKSTDGGVTWGAWEQISVAEQTAGENNYMGMTEQHFTLDGVIYMAGRVHGVFYSTVKMALYKSVDNGATWSLVSSMSEYADNTVEAAMEYLGNNNILVLCRDNVLMSTFRITSDDLGLTWSEIIRIESSINVIGRNRMFTDAHIKGQANWWTDQKLIMCGFVQTNPGASAGRRNAIWLSEDGGDSWTKPIYLDVADDDGGYGDLTYDPDTDTYRVVTYKGTLNEADLMQYDFKVNWTT